MYVHSPVGEVGVEYSRCVSYTSEDEILETSTGWE